MIYDFLKFIALRTKKNVIDISLYDLENLSIICVEDYLKYLSYSSSSKKIVITALSSLWNYFTVDSYSIDKNKPLFYRNVMNEWKICSKIKKNQVIKDNIKPIKRIFLNQEEISELLFRFDNEYVLELDTLTKIENWNKNKERDLALIAIIVGAGLSLEELRQLNVGDIDLRSKIIKVNRDNDIKKIKILDFALPYIKEYLIFRRKHRIHEEQSLFVNGRKKRVSTAFACSIIAKINKISKLDITYSVLRATNGYIIFKNTNNLEIVKESLGYNSTNALNKYIFNQIA